MKTAVLMLLLLAAVVSVSARGYGSGGGSHGGGHGGGYGGGGGGKKSKFNIGALFAKKKKLIGGIKQKIGGIFAAVKAPILRIKGKLLKKGGQLLTKKGRFFTSLASSLKNKFNKGGGGGGYGGGHGGGYGGGGRPSSGYGAPSRPSSGYGAPSSGYGAPSRPSSGYGAPSSGGHGGGGSGHSSGGHGSGGSGHSSGGHGGRGGSGGAVSSYSSYGTAKTFSLDRDQHDEVSHPTTTTTTYGDFMSPSPIWTSGGFRPMHPEGGSQTYTTSGSDHRHRQTDDESYTGEETDSQNYRSGQDDHETYANVQIGGHSESKASINGQSQTYSAPKPTSSQSYSAQGQRHTPRETNGPSYHTSHSQGTTRKPYDSPNLVHNSDKKAPAPSYHDSGNQQNTDSPSYQVPGNHQNNVHSSYQTSSNHQNNVHLSYQTPDNHQNTARPSYQTSGNNHNTPAPSYQASGSHQNTASPSYHASGTNHNTASQSYQNTGNRQNNAKPSYQNSEKATAPVPGTTYTAVGQGQLKPNSNSGRLEVYTPVNQQSATVAPFAGGQLATAHNQQSYGSQSSGSQHQSPRPNVFPGVTTGGSSVRFQGPSYTGSSVKTTSTSSVRPNQIHNSVQSPPQPGQTYSSVQSPPQPGQTYAGLGGTNRSPTKTGGTFTATQPRVTSTSSSYRGVNAANQAGKTAPKTEGLRTIVSYGGTASQQGHVTSQRQPNTNSVGTYSGDTTLSTGSLLPSNIRQNNGQRAIVGTGHQSANIAIGPTLQSVHPQSGTGLQSTHSNVLPATRFNTFSGTSGSSTGEPTLTPDSNSVSESNRPTLADQLGPDFDVDTIRKSIEANIARVTRSGSVFDPPLALAQRREDALETAAFLVDGVTITPAGLLTLELLRAQKPPPEAPVSSPVGNSVRPKRALKSATGREGVAAEEDSQSEGDVLLEVLTSEDNSQLDAVELSLRSSLSSSGDNRSRRQSALKSRRSSPR